MGWIFSTQMPLCSAGCTGEVLDLLVNGVWQPPAGVVNHWKSTVEAMVTVPSAPARAGAYVSNKAGLTGQAVPGRRIPGHWPYTSARMIWPRP